MKSKSTTAERSIKRRRITAVVSLCLALAVLTCLFVVMYRRFMAIGSTPEDFKEFIDSFGWTGWLVALGIQILQVIMAPLPGEIMEIGMGYAFGAVEGTLLCLTGVTIASAVVFLLTKRFGIRLLELFFSVESLNGLRFINSEKKLNRTVFLLFFIPGTPKDLLTYFVGLTRMKLSTFLPITLIARIPSVVSSVIGGNLISDRNYIGAFWLFAITGAVSLLGMWLYNALLRHKRYVSISKQGVRVIELFLKICAIPHGSGNTLKLAAFCLRFAKRRGLKANMDEYGNVWIEKPATTGYENQPPMILQAHLDMVCERSADTRINFSKEAITPVFEGDLLGANGTTLGADNGIGVAMCLAILQNKKLCHPPLQILLTVDEETGMKGALSLDFSRCKGDYLVNLDSEEEGVITVGCAGGVRISGSFPVERETKIGQAVRILLSGLTGGHSGVDIHRGRTNANKYLLSLLRDCCAKFPLMLSELSGGAVDNAIPMMSEATVILPPELVLDFCRRIAALEGALSSEWRVTDPGLKLTAEPGENATYSVLSVEKTKELLTMLTALPDGVQQMSELFPDKPETSLNFGILSMNDTAVKTVFALRSFRDQELLKLSDRLQKMISAAGGEVSVGSAYPGWEYDEDSLLCRRAVKVFDEQYGRPPQLDAVHAGLECGVFCGKRPGISCISLGPDITAVHTPEERVSLSSVDRVYRYLCRLLAEKE